MSGTHAPLVTRFWRWVNKRKSKKLCWEWTGCRDSCGYGLIGTGKGSRVIERAHRVSWKLHNPHSLIPKGIKVLHKCDNPACVNPDHLFLGTQLDNMKDMLSKGRSNYVKGQKQGLAKLTEEKVSHMRKLWDSGTHTLSELSLLFSVHWGTIWSAVTRRTWKHVKP